MEFIYLFISYILKYARAVIPGVIFDVIIFGELHFYSVQENLQIIFWRKSDILLGDNFIKVLTVQDPGCV